jgi:glycosyltransferase involved in cell wall biosynthesis
MQKVTIVTSVYNKAPWLRKCLDSFINQTYQDLKILIINNASTDESGRIIEEYKNKDSRISVIELKTNIGPAGAYALGIDNVDTEFFALCDSDDYIDLDYIEVLYNKIVSNNADFSMCCNDLVWDNGQVKTRKRPDRHELEFGKEDIPNLIPQLLDHESNKYLGYYLSELGVLWGKLYRTSFVKQLNVNYDKDVWIWCDWLFNLQLIKHLNKLVYTEETSYHFYQSSGSVTREWKMNWDQKRRIKIALDKFESELCSSNNEDIKLAKCNFYADNIFFLLNLYVGHYKRGTTKKDIKQFFDEISNWSQLNFIYSYSNGNKKISAKKRLKIKLIKKKVYNVFIFKKNIKRILGKN